MTYIILNDSHECDDCWHGGSSIDYVSLSKDNALKFLEKKRHYYMTQENNEIDVDEQYRFVVFIGNWCYSFEMLECPEDTDLRAYF